MIILLKSVQRICLRDLITYSWNRVKQWQLEKTPLFEESTQNSPTLLTAFNVSLQMTCSHMIVIPCLFATLIFY